MGVEKEGKSDIHSERERGEVVKKEVKSEMIEREKLRLNFFLISCFCKVAK